MDYNQTIKSVPKEMKDWLGAITEGYKFKKWESDPNWKKTIGTILTVKCDLTDVDAMSKKLGIDKKTVSNHKVVDVDLESLLGIKVKGKTWKVRFRETSKKTGSKAPDAKTTEKQEATSALVFELALKKKSGWITEDKFQKDKEVEKTIRKNYPEAYDDLDNDWISVFWKQHKTILDKLSSSQINKFDHKGGFMDFIGKVIKPLGVSKKDTWNPADIWGVRGNSASVIKKIEETVDGYETGTQTIQQLNALLRGMYKNKELIGISLKKTSGKEALWEEYNIDALTLKQIDDYKYSKITIIYNLKSTPNSQALDTAVQLRQSGGGSEYNFQITSNDTSKGDQNLKFESKPIGSAKARGGKAEIKQVEVLVEKLVKVHGGGTFENKHKKYPKNYNEFTKGSVDGITLARYKSMFDSIKSKVTTDCKDGDEFAQVIGKIFLGDKPWVAQSKLMQLNFLYHNSLIETDEEKYTEFWTDMLFLSIKKGDRFGPFAKLY